MKKIDIDVGPILIISFIVIILIMVAYVVCSIIAENRREVKTCSDIVMDEWISYDGVHYWYGTNGYLAPRYDANGELVIDK